LLDRSRAVLVLRDGWEPQSPRAVEGSASGGGVSSYGADQCLATFAYSQFFEVCQYHQQIYTLDEVEELTVAYRQYLVSELDSATTMAYVGSILDAVDGFDILRVLATKSLLGISSRILISEGDAAFIRWTALANHYPGLHPSIDESFRHLRSLRGFPMTAATDAKFGDLADTATIHLEGSLRGLRSMAEKEWETIPQSHRNHLDEDQFISSTINDWLQDACIISVGSGASHCSGSLVDEIISITPSPADDPQVVDGHLAR
ncbi:uncharacterized protein METZ01_LOCUS442317, partial [marine metagenome]